MKELHIQDRETHDFFVQAFKENTLVPILGSGFTKGAQTKAGGKVPSGTDFKNEMIDRLVSAHMGEATELEGQQFSSVAEFFQNTFTHPDQDGIIDYFRINFTNVRIDKVHQLQFLNDIDWPYVYTLNVDTGIEDSCEKGWEVFYPNKDFDDRTVKDGCKKLYKIHGDIAMFCKSMDYSEMILTESQYIASLIKNGKFHDLLTADCGNKNLLYIGCSLDDEIDIKFSVLSDSNRNKKAREVYGIYVTSENLTTYKMNRLEGYSISHIIRLQSANDYEYFYEFLFQCYCDSMKGAESNIDQFKFVEKARLAKDKESNLDYLAALSTRQDRLPFYYHPSNMLKEVVIDKNRVNVIVGRRFVGKSMLAYSMLESTPNYKRYYVAESESLAERDLFDLLNEENAFIVFDSESVDDKGFNYVVNNYDPTHNSVVVVFLNSFDDVANILPYNREMINDALAKNMTGRLLQEDVDQINEKLNMLGIALFNQKSNLLDNTLRIANVYNRNLVKKYSIKRVEELKMIIWLLIKSKVYYEDIVFLGLAGEYKKIVQEFTPFMQEERCKKGELAKHSSTKVICNGKLGLLQILSAYIYIADGSEAATNSAAMHKGNVCKAIFEILQSYKKIDMECTKEFLQFDKLNDIFSRVYSESSIRYVSSGGSEGRRDYGAVTIIRSIYSDERIQDIKANDPNYWLQRAKSTYIMNNSHLSSQCDELMEAIDWAKKSEQDSRTKVDNGEKRFFRTESNAIMQIAMLYGKIASLRKYEDVSVNESALEYYYKGFSDSNNVAAASTLLKRSRGTEDFKNFSKKLVENPNCVRDEWRRERDYIISLGINNSLFSYSDGRSQLNT